ncbi:AraC-like transcriptional regulator QhpR [Halopseudomonas maritima]|uniref:AraC-like transcriptional regulator QhpR n=1 Tax=Halopseudomonas maritima TaxID=2918528 RepID=UPI001EEADFA4|nr:AraC family transcriptional regulator [Halopseudomonas maritima]UJJ31475.1 AraC family transcriptional regulator [Halopseudomonas maritima]
MTSQRLHTIYAENFFRRNAAVFAPHLPKVGLNEAILSSPELEIPLHQYVALWEQLGLHESPSIGLEMGIQACSSDYGLYGHAARSAPTMTQALQVLSHFIAVLMQGTRVELDINDEWLSISYQVTDPLIINRRQDAEFTAASGLSLIREFVQQPALCPARADFEHAAPEDLTAYQRILGCPIHFDQPDNRLYYPRALLDVPMKTADSRLFQLLSPLLEEQLAAREADTDLLSQLRFQIASHLSTHDFSIERIADSMNIGVRTLQRRLAEYELGYSQLVEDVRRPLAENYVAHSGQSFTDIALSLGYSEASAFSRAFRRWTGLSPREFRQRARN